MTVSKVKREPVYSYFSPHDTKDFLAGNIPLKLLLDRNMGVRATGTE
jgi:hypothetical protein